MNIVSVVETDAVYEAPYVNVALNRPTFMSSVYHDTNGYYEASRAVDGNKDPVALKVDNSCSITRWEANPWWAVNLGAALSVLGVLVTNRAENSGNVSS